MYISLTYSCSRWLLIVLLIPPLLLVLLLRLHPWVQLLFLLLSVVGSWIGLLVRWGVAVGGWEHVLVVGVGELRRIWLGKRLGLHAVGDVVVHLSAL